MEGQILLLFILVLAIFLGIELITKVPSTLHTPLMSGANAISGITLVGALLSSGSGPKAANWAFKLARRVPPCSRKSRNIDLFWDSSCLNCSSETVEVFVFAIITSASAAIVFQVS